MPFLAPIFTAIGSAVAAISAWAAASPILAGLAQAAFGVALKYAISALYPPKTPSTSSQVETEYGANIPRTVVLGTCGLAGHHIYRCNLGHGGREFYDVYVLSSFRITGVPRVRYNGKWRTPVAPDANGFWSVPNEGSSGDNSDTVKVKFYYGTMDQVADPVLIATSRPAGRWTDAHRGAGVAYAIVYSQLHKKGQGLTAPAQLLFEVKGAPLYDWRKDSSVGGDGPHRWNDQSTWEYSDNNAVQIYNLERGFFNGNQRMVGKAVRAARLPLSEYTQAANICDEVMSDGSKRYRSHMIAKDGPGANHDANLTPLLEAMCGSWVERVDGEYPIAGAPQAVVATITDDDIKVGSSLRFTAKRKRTELINTVAASYVSPDDFYESNDAATRIDLSALAEDLETLASTIPYSAVTDIRQVDRLADIAIRGARFQPSAEITIHPRFLDVVKEGRWITFASEKYGTNTFQVLTRILGGHTSDGVRDITVSLQAISNGVFDPTAYETIPPEIIIVSPPDYLAAVDNFAAIPNVVESEGGGKLPGVRLSWDVIEDISVNGVLIEYWPVASPMQVFTKLVSSEISVVQIVEGLTSETDWQVRTTLQVDNGRSVAPSGITSFRTLEAAGDFVADLTNLGQDVKDVIVKLGQDINAIKPRLEAVTEAFSLNGAVGQIDRETIRAEVGQAKAEIINETRVRVTETEALAAQLIGVSADVNGKFADGLVSFQAVSAPAGVDVRFAVMLRAGDEEAFKSSGFFIEIYTEGGVQKSRAAFNVDQFAVTDDENTFALFAIDGGVVKMLNAKIEQAQIDNLLVGESNIEPGAVNLIVDATPVGGTGPQIIDITVNHGLADDPSVPKRIRIEAKGVFGRTDPEVSTFGPFRLLDITGGAEIELTNSRVTSGQTPIYYTVWHLFTAPVDRETSVFRVSYPGTSVSTWASMQAICLVYKQS